MSVVLVGYRGCGKTTVGRLLAERLGWSLVDTDELITAGQGVTIREIFATYGEDGFRELETAALEKALLAEKTVLSTGGGIVIRPTNRQHLQNSGHPVVYLSASPEQLLQRIRGDANSHANRPNLTALGGGIEEVRHLLALREPLYREVATLVVDASRPADVIAAEIESHLHAREEASKL